LQKSSIENYSLLQPSPKRPSCWEAQEKRKELQFVGIVTLKVTQQRTVLK
jgi:hypothetical protein